MSPYFFYSNLLIFLLTIRKRLTQQKYNLLREESEGFSKIINELNKGGLNPTTVDSVVANVRSLIGYFDLDPNRVFDIVLVSLILIVIFILNPNISVILI